MLCTGHFWSGLQYWKNAHCFPVLFLYLKIVENWSLVLIQLNTKKNEFCFIAKLGSLFQLKPGTFNFSPFETPI